MENYERKYKLLKELDYNNPNSEFICLNCKNIFKTSIHEIRRENRMGKHCPFCEISSKNSTKEHAEYKLKMHNKPFEIIEFNGLSGNSELLHTPCGNIIKTKISRILSKTNTDGCIYCSHGSVAYTPEYIRDEISDLTDGEYTVLSDYTKENIPIKIRHNICGNEWNVIRRNFVIGGTRCPNCSRIERRSKNIKLIESILTENKISFNTEVSYDDCRDIRSLPFDILIEDLNLIIEFDGEQHFHPWRFNDDDTFEKLKETHKHDVIKDNFTYSKNINFLRIPYTISQNKIYSILGIVINEYKSEENNLDSIFNYEFIKENLINFNNKNNTYYIDNGILPGVL